MKRYEDADATSQIPYLRDMSPLEVDTEIARVSEQAYAVQEDLERATNLIFHYAGRREYVSARRRGEKSHYVNHGTYEEAVEEIARRWEAQEAWHALDDAAKYGNMPEFMRKNQSLPYGGVDDHIAKRAKLNAEFHVLLAEINRLDAEWRRRGCWTRMFLVTSSNGHIHKRRSCQTCRITTTFGWQPQFSGMTDAEAIAALGAYAEMLCSVCFPQAPVAGKQHLTAAKARKMSAGPVVGME